MEAVGISYFWRRLFRHVDRFKFLLVLDESDLFSEDEARIFELFSELSHSFDLSVKSKETQGIFFNSISLLIVASSNPEQHQKHFARMT